MATTFVVYALEAGEKKRGAERVIDAYSMEEAESVANRLMSQLVDDARIEIYMESESGDILCKTIHKTPPVSDGTNTDQVARGVYLNIHTGESVHLFKVTGSDGKRFAVYGSIEVVSLEEFRESHVLEEAT